MIGGGPRDLTRATARPAPDLDGPAASCAWCVRLSRTRAAASPLAHPREDPIVATLSVLFWAGITSTLATLWLAGVARWQGFTRLRPGALLGCLLLPGAPRWVAGAAGFLAYLALGAIVFPLAYFAIFSWAGSADAVTGALAGAAHGVLAGSVLAPLGRRSRCIASGRLPAPGFFGRRLGAATPFGIVAAHVIYGAMLGYIFVVPAS